MKVNLVILTDMDGDILVYVHDDETYDWMKQELPEDMDPNLGSWTEELPEKIHTKLLEVDQDFGKQIFISASSPYNDRALAVPTSMARGYDGAYGTIDALLTDLLKNGDTIGHEYYGVMY